MKKKLIDALATKFPGVDAKDLGRIADNLLRTKTLTTDEDVNSAVEEVTFADILKSYGDSRAAEASKTAVSNYEKKHKLKDGKPATQTEDDDTDDDDDDSGNGGGEDDNGGKKSNAKKPTNKKDDDSELAKLLKSMNAKLDAQAAEIAAMKKGEVSKSRKARVAELIKGLSDIQKKAYNRIPVDDLSDEDFDSLMEEITSEVSELAQENKAGGGIFGLPLGGGNHGNGNSGQKTETASEAELKEIVDGMNL